MDQVLIPEALFGELFGHRVVDRLGGYDSSLALGGALQKRAKLGIHQKEQHNYNHQEQEKFAFQPSLLRFLGQYRLISVPSPSVDLGFIPVYPAGTKKVPKIPILQEFWRENAEYELFSGFAALNLEELICLHFPQDRFSFLIRYGAAII